MKKEKADLEQLLNSLIEKGFRPFWKKADHCLGCRYNNDWAGMSGMYKYVGFWWWDGVIADRKVPLRSLVSKSSWLWQFVCERWMVKHEVYEDIQSWEHTTAEHSDFWYTSWDNYEFYIIESSLKDESELEEFLLNSIKLD